MQYLLNEALNDPKREEGRQDFNEFMDGLINDDEKEYNVEFETEE